MDTELKEKIVAEYGIKTYKDKIVEEHTVIRHLTEIVITPEHVQRKESETFKKSKEKLKKDGHFKCWICGSTDELQVHHFGCEWSLEPICDFNKLKDILKLFDFYEYSKLMDDIPLTSVDDIRNMLVLCRMHHTEVNSGIHEITFPIWIAQKCSKDGENFTPNSI